MTHRFGTMRRQDAVIRIKTLLLDVQWSASQYAQDNDGALEADGLAEIARHLQQMVARYEGESQRTLDLDEDAQAQAWSHEHEEAAREDDARLAAEEH